MSAVKALLVGASVIAGAYSQCVGGDIDGTCFDTQVTNLVYQNIGYSGTWPNVAIFDLATCSVNMGGTTTFSGPLAPLNEEITIHFRGPIQIANVAVYYPTAAYHAAKLRKREEKREASLRRKHVHRHVDIKARAAAKYTATTTKILTVYADDITSTSSTSTSTSSSHSATPTAEWERTAFYDADSETSEGLTFMNNHGGVGSGDFSMCFGNTISYMSADGLSGAATPQVLAKNTVFPSNQEFSIWTNQTCDTSCGYSQPGTPAIKGFSGDNKVFVFKFMMPTDISLVNNNMPAVWFLNSRIGRTWQYPKDKDWTCWPYCGEFDVWEVLSPLSSNKMKSTLHSGQGAPDGSIYGGGGSSKYFDRPLDSWFYGAVAFLADGTISISVLDNFAFPDTLTTKTIKSWTPANAPTFKVQS